MAIRSVALLLDSLEDSPLLDAERWEELRGELPRLPADPRSIAEELTSRGWLTPFQADKVLEGRAEELSLGQYQLLDLLGEGGMGCVYKASRPAKPTPGLTRPGSGRSARWTRGASTSALPDRPARSATSPGAGTVGGS